MSEQIRVNTEQVGQIAGMPEEASKDEGIR